MSNLLKNEKRNLMKKGKYRWYILYALGEFLLLILGILIALQVDNWNEERKENREETRLLQQLVEDFNTNKLILSSSRRDYQRVMENIDAALRHTGPRAILPAPDVFDSIDNLWTPTLELLHTNTSAEYGLDLEPITNNQLKLAVMSFPATYSQYKELENTLKRSRFWASGVPLACSPTRHSTQMATGCVGRSRFFERCVYPQERGNFCAVRY